MSYFYKYYQQLTIILLILLIGISSCTTSKSKLAEYGPEFEKIMPSHLLPSEILDWARNGNMPSNALDIFIERRLTLIIEDIKRKLDGLSIEEIDSRQTRKIASAAS